MRINLNFNILPCQNINNNNKQYRYNTNLKSDCVTFGAMKKNMFENIDLAVVSKFNAPIETFNNHEDFQIWCFKKIQSVYINKQYEGRQEEITEDRKNLLKEWFEYCFEKHDDNDNASALLVIDGITSKLKSDNDKLPPVFNLDIVSETIKEIQEKSRQNEKIGVNFNKLYQANLTRHYLKDLKDNTGWIIIPSKKNSPADFEDNVNKLRTLSAKTWCTKYNNAVPYLSEGDFHIYFEDGKPKVGIRFNGDYIEEIQDEDNSYKIPVKYIDVIKQHIKGIKLGETAFYDMKKAEKVKAKTDLFKQKFDKPIDALTNEELFKAVGLFEARDEKDSLIILKSYNQPDKDFTWNDIGIDENNLLKEVKEIKGDIKLYNSKATTLGNVRIIRGNADFFKSRITDFGALEIIEGDADFQYLKTKNLGNIKRIGGNAFFGMSNIENLSNLEFIGGNADFRNSSVCNLASLKELKGCADIKNSKITCDMLMERGFTPQEEKQGRLIRLLQSFVRH